MKVYSEFENAAQTRLLSVAGVKTVEEYNEQYENTISEDPIGFPAVYFELMEPIDWEQLGNNHQAADVTIKLHVVAFYLKKQQNIINDLAQSVLVKFQGFSMVDSEGNQLSTEWIRSSSTKPKRYGNLKVIQIEFKGRLMDCSLMPTVTAGTFQFQIQA